MNGGEILRGPGNRSGGSRTILFNATQLVPVGGQCTQATNRINYTVHTLVMIMKIFVSADFMISGLRRSVSMHFTRVSRTI